MIEKELRKIVKPIIGDGFIFHVSTENDSSVYIMSNCGDSFVRVYIFEDDPKSACLDMLSVSEHMRRKGVATKLCEIGEKIAIRLDAKDLHLWTDKDAWMYDWYCRRGYKYYQEYEHQPNSVWMLKELEARDELG